MLSGQIHTPAILPQLRTHEPLEKELLACLDPLKPHMFLLSFATVRLSFSAGEICLAALSKVSNNNIP